MNPDNMQQQSVDMTPEEAKASLGLATRLSEQMLMAQAPQIAPPDAQNGQGSEQTQGMGDSDNMDIEAQDKEDKGDKKLDNSEEKMDGKMEILRTELKDTIKVEIDSIKQMIKDALTEENGEN